MGFGFYGWWSYLESDNQKPKVTWDLIKRVLRYAGLTAGRSWACWHSSSLTPV